MSTLIILLIIREEFWSLVSFQAPNDLLSPSEERRRRHENPKPRLKTGNPANNDEIRVSPDSTWSSRREFIETLEFRLIGSAPEGHRRQPKVAVSLRSLWVGSWANFGGRTKNLLRIVQAFTWRWLDLVDFWFSDEKIKNIRVFVYLWNSCKNGYFASRIISNWILNIFSWFLGYRVKFERWIQWCFSFGLSMTFLDRNRIFLGVRILMKRTV